MRIKIKNVTFIHEEYYSDEPIGAEISYDFILDNKKPPVIVDKNGIVRELQRDNINGEMTILNELDTDVTTMTMMNFTNHVFKKIRDSI